MFLKFDFFTSAFYYLGWYILILTKNIADGVRYLYLLYLYLHKLHRARESSIIFSRFEQFEQHNKRTSWTKLVFRKDFSFLFIGLYLPASYQSTLWGLFALFVFKIFKEREEIITMSYYAYTWAYFLCLYWFSHNGTKIPLQCSEYLIFLYASFRLGCKRPFKKASISQSWFLMSGLEQVFSKYWRICFSKAWKETRMDGKVVVITGANAGLGLESAKVLASRGSKNHRYYILSHKWYWQNQLSI